MPLHLCHVSLIGAGKHAADHPLVSRITRSRKTLLDSRLNVHTSGSMLTQGCLIHRYLFTNTKISVSF